ncbi:putative NAD(P)H oxidoreductase YdeQ [Brevibacillus reuszeri]|uniref:General stress protein n=1 Tax=Brevibacillus reuszeri TaxID=54915 RepID=A0A0K9YIT1_9BACL|nr:NAD(P)H-dependent oxidoreductase [Brevibacillus reuszeri]KNB68597.1 general stress protein [Brevibacillus reuszeri]MED1858880.1 NAD(P)H-dependent oxidoreductase [Brevibacillus reuszeri]GED69094.1 putative NAD(P)H oxidoreductase YdeQ [Brevibacillus reuszeri]
MKTLVIVAHPQLQQSRVNKRWAVELLKQPEHVMVHELYASYADKAIDVPYEQTLLADHERVVLQFPFQWYGTPSLLKQWLDEVFTTAWLFGSGGKAVAGKELLLAISIGGAHETYQAGGLIGYTISELTRPLQAFANQVGMTMLPHFTFYGAVQATEEQIEISARQYIQHIVNPELDPRIARRRMLAEMKQKMNG